MVLKKHKSIPDVDMPREKIMRNGASRLSEKELVAVLLRTGIRGKNVLEVAEALVSKYSLDELAAMDCRKLAGEPGLGPAGASAVIAAFEIARRLEKEQKKQRAILDTPEKIYRYVGRIHDSVREKFMAVYLNSRLAVIKISYISIGSVSASIVHPREVFKPAVECSASKIVLVHNHPSGDTSPSEEDMEITGKLKQAGEMMGIPVMDHLIVSGRGYFSMREAGVI